MLSRGPIEACEDMANARNFLMASRAREYMTQSSTVKGRIRSALRFSTTVVRVVKLRLRSSLSMQDQPGAERKVGSTSLEHAISIHYTQLSIANHTTTFMLTAIILSSLF